MKLSPCPKLPHGRSVEPEDTVRNLQAVLSKQVDYWVHQEQVDKHLFWSALFIEDMDFRAMGKGVTAMLSHAGALAEAAEWLACRETERLPGYRVAHQDDLDETDHLPIEDLLTHIATVTPPVLERIKNLPDAQYWVDGYSLLHEKPIKVPLEYVGVIGGPNGKASGNTLEEAIEHAVLEVFERRAHITVLRNRLVMPTLDPATIEDPLVRELMDFIDAQGVEVILKDLSFDGALPCLGAYFKDPHIPDHYQFHHFFKVGSSFNRIEALTRIFTEYVQGRARDEFIRGTQEELDRILRHDFRSLRVMDDAEDNFMSAFMFGFVPYRNTDFLRAGDVIPFEPTAGYGDSLDDIRHAQSICQQLDKDLIVVDLSDPEIDFGVAQVIVPGYSDVLPYHPAGSPGLFQRITRPEILAMYDR